MVKAFRRTKEVSHCVKCVFLVRSYPFERSNASFEFSSFGVNAKLFHSEIVLSSFLFFFFLIIFVFCLPFLIYFSFLYAILMIIVNFEEKCNEEVFLLFFFILFVDFFLFFFSLSLLMRDACIVQREKCSIIFVDVNSVSSWLFTVGKYIVV